VCYFWASFGLSLAVGSLVKNQQTAMMVMLLLLFVPSFFLAGLVTPVDTSSPGALVAAYSLPVTHFIFICRAVFLKGSGLAELVSPALALVGLGSGLVVLSLAAFNKWMD
jgi:ABC-type multidrug transport system permease subunit